MTVISDHQTRAPRRRSVYWRFNRYLERHLPSGLYPRSLLIVIVPMLLLQTIMAGIFMERHWDEVTKRLSRSVARDMALVIAVYERSPRAPEAMKEIMELTREHLSIDLQILTDAKLPPPGPKPFFSLLDLKLSKYIAREVKLPFWIDTIGQSGIVDARIQVEPGVVFRFLTDQDRAYASSTYIFLMWMAASTLVLLILSVVFLRNQIKPILQLARAAHAFGMGRDVEDFEPRGAAEVQTAARAFVKMKNRIERHVDQRTAMLAGVSHDLRTILTRFKLELAFLDASPHVDELKQDVDEMQGMLEGYMAFVRGDGGEQVREADIAAMLGSVAASLARTGTDIRVDVDGALMAPVKPDAFKRCIANLAANAARHGRTVAISAHLADPYLIVTVDDDGPGIPEDQRKAVFRPFVRLDEGRNLDEAGTGLGLAIALDIAHSHGGRIMLDDSPMGGLRATVRVPV